MQQQQQHQGGKTRAMLLCLNPFSLLFRQTPRFGEFRRSYPMGDRGSFAEQAVQVRSRTATSIHSGWFRGSAQGFCARHLQSQWFPTLLGLRQHPAEEMINFWHVEAKA